MLLLLNEPLAEQLALYSYCGTAATVPICRALPRPSERLLRCVILYKY
jgi:hypothetical protein